MRHMVIHCIARSQVPKGSRYIYAFEPRVAIDGEARTSKHLSDRCLDSLAIIVIWSYL